MKPNIAENKHRIISYLQSTQRKGIDSVIAYLEENDFYNVPSSRHRHHNWRGGLAQHSLGVLRRALYDAGDLPRESVIIAALLHDICKTRCLYYDNDGKLKRRQLKISGHGYRSIKILQSLGLELSEDERLAIRWHMGAWPMDEAGMTDRKRAANSRLWQVIHRADGSDAHAHPHK